MMEKDQVTYLRAPLMVWYDITTACNFHCKHCYSASGKASPDELNTSEAKQLIHEIAAKGVFYIYILGGEPFLRPDFMQLLGHMKHAGLSVMINTNGWYVDDVTSDELALIGVEHLRFSLDGANAETHDKFRGKSGSYRRVLDAIRRVVSRGVRVSVSYTMTRDNYREIEAVCDLLAGLKVSEVFFGQLSNVGRASGNMGLALSSPQTHEAAAVIENSRRRYWPSVNIYSVDGTLDRPCTQCVSQGKAYPDFMGCQAGRTCCNITPMGDVVPCLLWRSPVAGNVRDKTFDEIWDESELFRKLRQVRDYPECRVCPYRNVCARECPLSSSQSEVKGQDRLARAVAVSRIATCSAVACRSWPALRSKIGRS
jgi:radical SAM protein with 4Fe4S-binding SPASM domain